MKRMWDKKVLQGSTAQIVETMVESGELENAKPIYWHTIQFQRGGDSEQPTVSRVYGLMIVLNNSSAPLTLTDFQNLLKTPGFKAVIINGKCAPTGGSDLSDMTLVADYIVNTTEDYFEVVYRDPSTNEQAITASSYSIALGWIHFDDLGANKIN